jgi:hypothetical protein
MFDSALLVRELARKEDAGSIARAMGELWPLNYDIVHRPLEALNPIVIVPSDAIEVNTVFITRTPLSRTREILLDAEDPQWRNANPDLPKAFIWRGEEKHIRLHPRPDAAYELWALIQRTPKDHFPKWFHLIAALRAVETLSESDPVVGRLKMVEFMKAWREAFLGITK